MKLSVILPAYNEEGNIPVVYDRVRAVLKDTGYDYEIIFVNDGSTDGTKKRVLELIDGHGDVRLISFSRNFGHQFALIAGYRYCKGDAAITMDCDLQHPPELIPELIKKWKEGYAIVNTLRVDGVQKNLLKKYTSKYYYRLFSWICGFPIEEGSADFRLTDRQVIDSINDLQEYELFLRGMFHWLGYSSASISYVPNKRYWGKTKYSLRKMLHLAINGITSFSILPLRIVTVAGFVVSGLALLYMLYSIYSAFVLKDVISGWTSLIISVLFLGGIQLISIGILGVYLGKVFIETKKRPKYVIDLIKG